MENYLNNNVAVLLSTYNGAKFLPDLLKSMESQKFNKFDLIIRDDGSSDNTLEIVQKFIENNKISIELISSNGNLGKPELSLSSSFFNLLEFAKKRKYSYFLFSDQDDIWYEEKIEKLLHKIRIEEQRNSSPMLVHSDLEVVDAAANQISPSLWRWIGINPMNNSTSRLLFQNTVTGCSVIFNKALAEKIKAGPNIFYHDWRIALVASMFGKIVPLDIPLMKYRQHGTNVSGAGGQKKNIFSKIINFFKINDEIALKTIRSLNKIVENAIMESQELLNLYGDSLPYESKNLLLKVASIRKKNFLSRKYILLKGKFVPKNFTRAVGIIISV